MALRFTLTRIVPSAALFVSLLVAAVLVDYVFHVLHLARVGRYLGVVGSLLILASFVYSLRKRKLIRSGSPKTLLRNHEVLGWTGSLLLLVHGGIHFNAFLPWLAVLAMLVVVASGLTGRYLLEEARERLKERAAEMKEAGVAPGDAEKELLGQSLVVDSMKEWRKVHMPLTMVFAALALLHVVVTTLFQAW